MNKLYLYPNSPEITNPYIRFLADALSVNFTVLNYNKPSNKGILDIFRYFKNIDILYLNWIENLPGRYLGYLQSLLFLFLFLVFKISGRKIVWTLHNKRSHSEKHMILKTMLYKVLIKYSDLVVTHAEEGLELIPDGTGKLFIPHPVKEKRNDVKSHVSEKEFDIIIWGTIAEYKGVHTFLEFLEKESILSKYRILIAGKVKSINLSRVLNRMASDYANITLIDQFLSEKNLESLIEKSRIVLFTYQPESVLSSGALSDSLQFDAAIIGPDTGAFHDLSKLNIVRTYAEYSDLMDTIDNQLQKSETNMARDNRILEYIKDNSWKSFSNRISDYLNEM